LKPRAAAGLLTGILRPWLGLAIVCAGFSLNPTFRHTFWTPDFLGNVLQQGATNIIVAVGMTFVILSAGIDLSVGSVLALCGVALGMTVTTGPPPFLAYIIGFPLAVLTGGLCWKGLASTPGARTPVTLLASVVVLFAVGQVILRATAGGIRLEWALLGALAVGASCGLMNGLVVAVGKVPPFVMTLGMYTAARGLTVYATNGNSVSGLPPRLATLGQGWPLITIALAVVAVGILVLSRTRTGRYISAIGGNEEAARLSAVNVSFYKTLAYVISGITAAIAAIVLTAKFQVASTNAATGAELDAIAAVVIGGTSLSGGRGSVIGSLVGALTIVALNNGLVLVGVQNELQRVVIGVVIVLTVMVDQVRWWRPRVKA
jgi:ribose transport system permease protein